ncbi:hypothetical protein SERLA73DRAFT_132644, partial [Serpula lacrymans var. lacrymans S7.3]
MSRSPRLSTSPARSPFSDDREHTGRSSTPPTPGVRTRRSNPFGEPQLSPTTSQTISDDASVASGSFYRMNEPPIPTLRGRGAAGTV